MAWRSALSKNLQELRISLSQTSPGSQVAAYLIGYLSVNHEVSCSQGPPVVHGIINGGGLYLERKHLWSASRCAERGTADLPQRLWLQGVRDFVLSSYQELKKANPNLPILVRESMQAEAKLTARYDFGTETAVSVEGMDKTEISKTLEELVKRGESMPR